MNDTQGAEQTPVAPLSPERLAHYRRAAQDAIHSYHGDRCSLTIQALDLLALAQEVEAWRQIMVRLAAAVK